MICIRVLPVARLPASDFCLVASGDAVFAGGEQLEVTRREASDWQPQKYSANISIMLPTAKQNQQP